MNLPRDENGLLLARTSGGPPNRSSRYLGVTYQGQCANRPWRAMVWDREHKRNRSLGGFVTEIEAAQAVTDCKDGMSALPDDGLGEMAEYAAAGIAPETVHAERGLCPAELSAIGLEFRTHWICRGCGAAHDPTSCRCRKCGSTSFERCALRRKGLG